MKMKILNSALFIFTFASLLLLGNHLNNFYISISAFPACILVAIILHRLQRK
jgi:hypothetical protein